MNKYEIESQNRVPKIAGIPQLNSVAIHIPRADTLIILPPQGGTAKIYDEIIGGFKSNGKWSRKKKTSTFRMLMTANEEHSEHRVKTHHYLKEPKKKKNNKDKEN